MIEDNDILNKYENSLKEANIKIKEAEIELENSRIYFKEQAEDVNINYFKTVVFVKDYLI